MEGRMFGLETPLMTALQHLLDIPDGEKQGGTGAGGPTRAYVRDARAMAATPADVKELLGAYAFVVDMPGLGSGDLKVEDEWVLVVSGERRSEREAERARGGDGAGSGEGLPRQARIAGPASAGALPTGVDSRITEEEAIAGEKSSPKARQQEQAAEETEKKMEELKVLRSKKAEMDARVASLEKELAAAVAKRVDLEVAAKAFDAEKTEIVKELEGLKRKVVEIQADKEAAERATHEKDAQSGKLRAELEELHASMSQLQASRDELDTKRSRLHSEKKSVQKALDAEKAEASKLRSTIEALENCNGKMDCEIRELKVALEEKKGKIEVLTNEAELLQLAVTEAQKRKKGGVWAWLYAATTTMVAAISLIYATRAH